MAHRGCNPRLYIHGLEDYRTRVRVAEKAVITLSEYQEPHGPMPEDVKNNAIDLLAKVNALLSEIQIIEAMDPIVNSGWRPAYYNKTVPNAAVNSKHITGQAVDIRDPDGALDEHLHTHFRLLIKHGLWMEHPSATKGWCHLQCVPPRSGNRIFYP